MPKKPTDYTTPQGVREWQRGCGFTDKQAAEALEIPFRTYCRYKASGFPLAARAAQMATAFTIDRMEEIMRAAKK